jgi:hypothetical protein
LGRREKSLARIALRFFSLSDPSFLFALQPQAPLSNAVIITVTLYAAIRALRSPWRRHQWEKPMDQRDDEVERIVAAIAELDNDQLALLFDRLGVLEQQAETEARSGLN